MGTSCSCSGCLWPRSLSSGEHPPAPSTPAALTRARSALALYRCQAFVPPASGISRVAVRNAASIDTGAKKKPKKKPVKKQAQSDEGSLFVHEGTKGFVGDPNAFVYQIGLAS